MQIIKRKVPNNFNIFLIGDEHIGSLMYHEDGWKQMVDMVTAPYDGVSHNIVVDHGDAIEAIKTDDPRFQAETTMIGNILSQAEYAKRSRTAIQKQLVTILNGNHEAKLHRFGDIMGQLICQPLGVPYGTYSCHITYHDKDGNDILKHFAFHGAGSIQSIADDAVRRAANRQLSLKRKMKEQFGDTALMSMGHTHQLHVTEPVKTLFLTVENDTIKQNYTSNISTGEYIHPDHRWYVNTGSFMRLYGEMGVSGYAERAGYAPIMLGFAVAKVRDRKLVGVDKVYT